MSPVIKMAVPLYVAFKNPFNLSKSCVISLKATAPSARPCLYSWYCHSCALGTILWEPLRQTCGHRAPSMPLCWPQTLTPHSNRQHEDCKETERLFLKCRLSHHLTFSEFLPGSTGSSQLSSCFNGLRQKWCRADGEEGDRRASVEVSPWTALSAGSLQLTSTGNSSLTFRSCTFSKKIFTVVKCVCFCFRFKYRLIWKDSKAKRKTNSPAC